MYKPIVTLATANISGVWREPQQLALLSDLTHET